MSYHNEHGERVSYDPDLLEPLSDYAKKLSQRIEDVRWHNPEVDTTLLQQHYEMALEDMNRGVKFHVKF